MGRGQLFPRFVEHDRDCGCATLPAQRLDKSPRQLVCHRGTGNRGGTGNTCQPDRYGTGTGADSYPYGDDFASYRAIDLRRDCRLLGGLVYPARERDSPYTTWTGRERGPRPDGGRTQTCAYREILLAVFVRLVYWTRNLQRRHNLGGKYHPTARVYPDRCRHARRVDAGWWDSGRSHPAAVFRQTTQAAAFYTVWLAAGDPGLDRTGVCHERMVVI